MGLTVTLNHSQKRLGLDRLPVVAAGVQFNTDKQSGVWSCPVKDVIMLFPRCLSGSWSTSNAGDFEKLAKASYTLADGSKWENRYNQAMTGPWLCTIDSEYNAAAVVTTAPDKNRGQYLAWYAFGEGSSFVQMECGWGGDGVLADADVALRFNANGSVLVYKDGELVGQGNYSGTKSGQNTAGTLVQIMLLPWCVRELLVYSISAGNGFSHVFVDIDPTDDDPTIVPADNFWWKVPSGATQVMCAPMKFAESGYASSEKLSFFEAPLATDDFEIWENPDWPSAGTDYKLYGDQSFEGTVDLEAVLRTEDDSGTFTPDGIDKVCRIRMILSGDGNYTPFARGAQFAYASSLMDTDGESSQELLVTRLEFSVGEEPNEIEMEFSVQNPYELEIDAPNCLSQTNLPVKMELDGVLWMDGKSQPIKEEADINEETGFGDFTIRDGWVSLENYLFVEQFPLDDVRLDWAIAALVQAGGYDLEDMIISESTYRFPKIMGEDSNDWNVLIKPGDTAADWLRRIMEDYAADWHYGFRPTVDGIIFYALAPEDLPSVPQITLYRSIEDAVDEGIDEEEAWKYLVRNFDRTPVPLEANDIRVSGEDPVTGRLIQSYKYNVDSIDPTIAVASRTKHWIGEIRRTGLYNNGLRTQADTDWACEVIYNRLFNEYGALVEIESEILRDNDDVPFWKSDLIEIFGDPCWYRILAFGADFLLIDDELLATEVRYTLIEVPIPV